MKVPHPSRLLHWGGVAIGLHVSIADENRAEEHGGNNTEANDHKYDGLDIVLWVGHAWLYRIQFRDAPKMRMRPNPAR